jgi:CBS domain-containing protein
MVRPVGHGRAPAEQQTLAYRMLKRQSAIDKRARGYDRMERYMQIARLPKSKRVEWALTLERPTLNEPAARVSSIMSSVVYTCRVGDPLSIPAQVMWDHDCGCVPVVDADNRVVGMITDRDICMAAYTQGKHLSEIAVETVCSTKVQSCHADALVIDAAKIMARAQVRRLVATDAEGRLLGILTLSDLIRHAWSTHLHGDEEESGLAELLESVSRPRQDTTSTLHPLSEREREVLAEYYAP